jgi:hypothetical protein
MTAVLARRHDIDCVFTSDADEFRTLGLTAVPGDTGDA